MLKKEDLITGIVSGLIASVIFTLLWPSDINSGHIWNFIFYFIYIGIFAWTLYAFLSKKEVKSPLAEAETRFEPRFGKKIRRINLCLLGVSTIVLAWLIYASYHTVPTVKVEEPKAFKEEDYGILVAGFEEEVENPKHTGKSVQGTIKSSLNARFRELKMDDTEAREIPVSYIPFFESHEHAREITQLATYAIRQRMLKAMINDITFNIKHSFVTAWIFFGKKFVIWLKTVSIRFRVFRAASRSMYESSARTEFFLRKGLKMTPAASRSISS